MHECLSISERVEQTTNSVDVDVEKLLDDESCVAFDFVVAAVEEPVTKEESEVLGDKGVPLTETAGKDSKFRV